MSPFPPPVDAALFPRPPTHRRQVRLQRNADGHLSPEALRPGAIVARAIRLKAIRNASFAPRAVGPEAPKDFAWSIRRRTASRMC
jgi:hypothetical protein